MPRWYAARRCFGYPESITQQVAALVQQNDLGAVVPLIRFEKRSRGQFFMFLAIESERPGELTPELQPLRQHSIFKGLMHTEDGRIAAFTLDQIRGMVSGEIEVKEYARRLRVSLPAPPVLADPFPAGEEPDEAAESATLERSQRFDRLILWLSAAGNGTRATFFSASQSLGLANDGREAGYILRSLRLLGHVESSRDGERWFIAPAVLARAAALAPHAAAVLCGERDPRLLQALHTHAAVEQTPQPRGAAPARVLVRTDDPEKLEALLRAADLIRPPRQGQPALRLTEALPPLDRWPDMLTAVQLVPELYEWRRFNGHELEPVPWQGHTGMYEYVPREGRGPRRDQRPTAVFYDAERGAFLRGDWYGLRCLAHLRAGLSCPAHYDVLSARLALPIARRPPEIYERALVLSSGRLPERRGSWLWYDDIELDVITLLAVKLNLALGGTDPDA